MRKLNKNSSLSIGLENCIDFSNRTVTDLITNEQAKPNDIAKANKEKGGVNLQDTYIKIPISRTKTYDKCSMVLVATYEPFGYWWKMIFSVRDSSNNIKVVKLQQNSSSDTDVNYTINGAQKRYANQAQFRERLTTVVITFDGSIRKLYVNNIYIGLLDSSTNQISFLDTDSFMFSRDGTDSDVKVKGIHKFFGWYDRVLSDKEISEITGDYTKVFAETKTVKQNQYASLFQVIGGITKLLGMVSEINASQSISKFKTKSILTALENNLALSITSIKSKPLLLANETDNALSIDKSQSKQINVTTEADQAITFSSSIIKNILTVNETDSALNINKSQYKAINKALETDLSLNSTSIKSKPLAITSETDSALIFDKLKSKAINAVNETNLSLTINVVTGNQLNTVIESDQGFALGKEQSKPINFASENDSALSFGSTSTLLIGTAFETDSAFTIDKIKQKEIGTVLETDNAGVISIPVNITLGMVSETDEALSIIVSGVILVRSSARTFIMPAIDRTFIAPPISRIFVMEKK